MSMKKKKFPKRQVSTPLGWGLDHGRGPFKDAVSRAVDSAPFLRFGRAVDPVLLLP